MITRVSAIGDANTHDQIVFYAFHSLLREVQRIAGSFYMLPAKIYFGHVICQISFDHLPLHSQKHFNVLYQWINTVTDAHTLFLFFGEACKILSPTLLMTVIV